jgi:glutamate-1-semialdehyde 2,1-aminomutase
MNELTLPRHLVGGISSAARALPVQDGVTFLASRSDGPYIWDQAGRRYLDTALGFGATILGHAHPVVVDAVSKALANGPMPAYAHADEEAAAAALAGATAHLSKVVFTNTGSEAVHLACRLARAVTGRSKIAKAAAGYDGWYDDIAFGNAGSREALMDAVQRPENTRSLTLFRFNDFDDVDKLFADHRDIAAILIEPVLANAGCVMPVEGYLEHVETVAHRNGALVILDEVLMGFRTRFGLAGHALGIKGDLAAVGKAIGSGIAVAAVVGTPEIMAAFETGKVSRAGTYSGNPVATAAVRATMAQLKSQDYPALLRRGNTLREAVGTRDAVRGRSRVTTGYGSVFTIWFTGPEPTTYAQASERADAQRSLTFHHELRRRGVLVMPSPLGRLYLSFAHTDAIVRQMAAEITSALTQLA